MSPLTNVKLGKTVLAMYTLAKALEAIVSNFPQFDITAFRDNLRSLSVNQYNAHLWINGMHNHFGRK